MAQSNENILIRGLFGTIGDLLTFRQRYGKTIVSKIPVKSSVPPTEKATAVRVKFKKCITYAKFAARDPVKGPLYKAVAVNGLTAYNVALADAYHAPEVMGIETANYHGNSGDTITIKAKDDFKVITVSVFIFDPVGNLIEQGDALNQVNESDWLYVTTQRNENLIGSKIRAIASDMPGNTGSLEIEM